MSTRQKYTAFALLACLVVSSLVLPPARGAGEEIKFPDDEGAHYTTMEWWYLNFHQMNQAGFVAVARVGWPGQSQDYLLVGLGDLAGQSYRSAIYEGRLSAAEGKLDLAFEVEDSLILRWYQEEGSFRYHLMVDTAELALDQHLVSAKAPLLEGGDGLVPIGSGMESYYYSLTQLYPPDGQFLGWMDHQWFDWVWPLFRDQPHHEWFSIQLSDGTDIVAWEITDEPETYRNFDLLDATGEQYNSEVFDVTPLEYWMSPSGSRYARKWRLVEPVRGVDVIVETAIGDQLVTSRWGEFYEGAVRVSGKIDRHPVEGVGFAELTRTYSRPDFLPFVVFLPSVVKNRGG